MDKGMRQRHRTEAICKKTVDLKRVRDMAALAIARRVRHGERQNEWLTSKFTAYEDELSMRGEQR
jgi:hypothetical protein